MTDLTVVEGGSDQTITVKSSLPPRLMCSASSGNRDELCSVRINIQLRDQDKPVYCADGRPFPQVLIGWQGKKADAFCGAVVTVDNWYTGVSVSVRATMDALKDRDQKGQLQFEAELVVSGMLMQTVTMQVVQVNTTCRSNDMQRCSTLFVSLGQPEMCCITSE